MMIAKDVRIVRWIDVGVFAIANLINVLLAVIFLARARSGTRDTPVENIAGWIVVAMALIPVVYSHIAYRRIEGFAPDPDVDNE